MKPVLFFSILLTVSIYCKAQSFPKTENEIYQIIFPSSWHIKYMLVDDRQLDAERSNMKVNLQFGKDSSYQLTFLGNKLKGKIEINTKESWIRLIDPEQMKDHYIIGLEQHELRLQAYGQEGDEPILIMQKTRVNEFNQ